MIYEILIFIHSATFIILQMYHIDFFILMEKYIIDFNICLFEEKLLHNDK